MKKEVKIPKYIHLISVLLFLWLIGRIVYISFVDNFEGTNIEEFAKNRTTAKIPLPSIRGTIYDRNKDVLAKNISSYNIILYLEEKRTTNSEHPRHVVDYEKTATELGKALDLDKKYILKRLNLKKENPKLYQVELGPKGRNLTELKKDEIMALGLPGIDFEESVKRYYPYGEFLSYTLGYAVKEDDKIVGKMGIEKFLDETLKGKDGYVMFQKDRKGFRIPNTLEKRQKEQNGKDVYLTIDSHIQMFVEQAIRRVKKESSWKWYSFLMIDAKTGEIISVYQDPSFDPNKRDITNYLDYNFSYPYEPGSTMKIYTYMLAKEKGLYDPNKTFKSGTYVTKDKTELGDWKRAGWGNITYDRGFRLSANTGVINLIKLGITGSELKEFYTKLGFGKKVGIPLYEGSGTLPFKYETEILNASFGQGLTTTPLQHAQALTTIANSGDMLRPTLIKKITPYNGDKALTEQKIEKTNVINKKIALDMKKLMTDVVNYKEGTGHTYELDGYDIALKTGTAQVPKENGKGYSGSAIHCVAGMWPAKDPAMIFVLAVKDPRHKSGYPTRTMKYPLQEIIKNTSGYLNVFRTKKEINSKKETFKSFINENPKLAKEYYKERAIIIGNGTKIVQEMHEENEDITGIKKLYFKTNGKIEKYPSFKGLSQKEARALCHMLNLNCDFKGSGFVKKEDLKKFEFILGD